MVRHCSKCGKEDHDVRKCPQLKFGAEQVAEKIISGAGEKAVEATIIAVFPPAAVGVAAYELFKIGADLYNVHKSKTKSEQKNAIKHGLMNAVVGKGFD